MNHQFVTDSFLKNVAELKMIRAKKNVYPTTPCGKTSDWEDIVSLMVFSSYYKF